MKAIFQLYDTIGGAYFQIQHDTIIAARGEKQGWVNGKFNDGNPDSIVIHEYINREFIEQYF